MRDLSTLCVSVDFGDLTKAKDSYECVTYQLFALVWILVI
jgi:hypothetical protein